MRRRGAVLATLVLAVVLLVLAGVTWSAIASIKEVQADTEAARASVTAYTDLQHAVAAEAFAEAGYRRAPSEDARARIGDSIRAVDAALKVARERTGQADGAVLSQLSLLNQRYVKQVRATLDTPQVGIDDRVAGPALDSIQLLLDSALAGHRAELTRALDSQSRVVNRLSWLLPVVFVLAFGVLGWIWLRQLQEQRRLARDATAHREIAAARQRLLVEEQRQVGQLRELNRAREELVAMVTHDLGTPITVIRGYAELIAESGELPADLARPLAAIHERSEQLAELVSDMADLTRVSAIRSVTAPVRVDLADLVLEVLDAVGAGAAARGLSVHHRLTPGVVAGDPARLRQVVDNLIGNAVKYTRDGGTIEVRVETDGDEVLLQVSDTGIGIPVEQMPFVFDRFYRASTATATEIPGTGLGLAICQAIVDAHGGTVTVRANQPSGTVFEVHLPRAARH